MHELSLCQSILQVAKKYVIFPHVAIKNIYLEVGVLATVEKTALQFNFDILKKGTVAEKAILHFIDVPGEATCDACHKAVEIKQYYQACPSCLQFALTITKGQELRIKSIEVL